MKKDPFLQRINQILEENLSDDQFKINDLCNKLSLSRMQVHRKVVTATGPSTSKYVRRYRLRVAAKLLRTSDVSITEIAYRVGFKELTYFTRLFRKSTV